MEKIQINSLEELPIAANNLLTNYYKKKKFEFWGELG